MKELILAQLLDNFISGHTAVNHLSLTFTPEGTIIRGIMPIPQYRISGYPSGRSLNYLKALTAAGWPPHIVEDLKLDIPRFESASVLYDFESSLKACTLNIDKVHHPFLQDLNEHIKMSSRAEINEELRRKATCNDKDSIAASALLSGMSDKRISSLKGGNSVQVNNPQSMTMEDLEKEIKAAEKRLQ